MRIEDLTVALRPRSSWEAVELGTALTRRHARAVWRPWLACTLPAFAVLNALCWLLGYPAIAGVAMWWLKPLFDRIPLFVLSRAVFGAVPTTRATLHGAFRGSGRAMLGYLTWRRLSPARALLMPVDVLEGGDAQQAGARRRVLAGPAYGVASLTLLVFANFELALMFGLLMLAFVFVPPEYVRSSAMLAWQQVQDAPRWLLLVQNVLLWAATSLLEPFYVGSGFGQYLNRRTQIEGWDIELAFRRLRARLLAAGSGALLLACIACMPTPSFAAAKVDMQRCPLPARNSEALQRPLGPDYHDPAKFHDAVNRAYDDPRLHPHQEVKVWKRKHPETKKDEPASRDVPAWLRAIGAGVGMLGEGVLWALVVALVLLLVFTTRYWLPWLRGFAPIEAAPPSQVVEQPLQIDVPLPPDIVASVSALWVQQRHRDALSLLYRAAVEAMLATTGRMLPPGATEAQCLRASQTLADAPRGVFARVVRLWQYAAYAERLPRDDEFDATLRDAATQFGWRA